VHGLVPDAGQKPLQTGNAALPQVARPECSRVKNARSLIDSIISPSRRKSAKNRSCCVLLVMIAPYLVFGTYKIPYKTPALQQRPDFPSLPPYFLRMRRILNI
jgi:hypothetical protein